MKTYSAEFKSGIIAKMMPPNNVSVTQMSQETGIPKDTLYSWRLKARGYRERDLLNGAVSKDVLGSEDKFNIVLETAGMNAEELSAYCRRKGLYPDQIASWTRQCTAANEPQKNKVDREKLRHQEREIKQLRADQLLILADCGGSNGYRTRLWKHQLQVALADCFNLLVKVCHYPPGASKWNPIEHRLFSFISNNWAAHPLTDYETVLKFIRTTKTSAGLRVRAVLHTKKYQKGIRICDKQMKEVNLKHYTQRPNWNYSIGPVRNVI